MATSIRVRRRATITKSTVCSPRRLAPVNAKAGVYFAPKQSALDSYPTHHNTYVYGELSGGIPGTPITLHSHLGHTGGGFDWAGKQYLDYSVGASVAWKNLTLDASVVGTNAAAAMTRWPARRMPSTPTNSIAPRRRSVSFR